MHTVVRLPTYLAVISCECGCRCLCMLPSGRKFEFGWSAESFKTLNVQGCGISFIIVHRFLEDMAAFVQTLQYHLFPSACTHPLTPLQPVDSALPDTAIPMLINLTHVSVMLPETGWSSTVFVLNSGNVRIEPSASGRILRNHVQASLTEYAPRHCTHHMESALLTTPMWLFKGKRFECRKMPVEMAQGILLFESGRTVGICQDVAFELELNNTKTPRTASAASDIPPVDTNPFDQLLTVVIKNPTFYRMRVQRSEENDCTRIHHRKFAHGSTIVMSLERRLGTHAPSVTVFWAHLQVLAGEAQFSQMMRTLFGNLGEEGFDMPFDHSDLPAGTFIPAQEPPPSLQLPDDDGVVFTTNIELGEAMFLTEAKSRLHCDSGARLAQTELSSTKVQHTLTAGGI